MKSKVNLRIEREAQALLDGVRIDSVPVAVELVASRFGLSVQRAELGDGVSGVLVVNGESATIGVNPHQAPVRQRFTIAHELGHYVLHRPERSLFIDKQYTAVYRRDEASATGEHLREIEANQFAAALLMPKTLLLQEVKGIHFDQGDEDGLKRLAERFQVSSQAMSLRLSALGLFTPTD